MSPQCNVGFFFYEEGVLHFTCRMGFRKVQRREVVPIVLYFLSFGKVEAYPFKNFSDPLTGGGKWVYTANGDICGRQCQIYFRRGCAVILVVNLFNQLLKLCLSQLFYFIDSLSIGFLLLVRNKTHISKQLSYHTFFTDKLHAVRFQLFWSIGLGLGNSYFDLVYFILIHVQQRLRHKSKTLSPNDQLAWSLHQGVPLHHGWKKIPDAFPIYFSSLGFPSPTLPCKPVIVDFHK